jgi:hypothetical protein
MGKTLEETGIEDAKRKTGKSALDVSVSRAASERKE